MWNSLRRWLSDFPTHDPLERQQASLLQIMLIGMLISGPVILLVLFFARFYGRPFDPSGLTTVVLVTLCTGIALSLLRRGRFNLAVLIGTGGFLFPLAIPALTEGISRNSLLVFAFALPITLAGLLIGRRGTRFTAAVSIAIVISAAYIEQFVRVGSNPSPPPLLIATGFTILASLLALFFDRFGFTLREALSTALAHQRELEQTRISLETYAAELSKANEELKREIAERKRLEMQLLQSQKLESIGRLAGGVAHDFNNLLTAIIGNTELAFDALPPGHPVRADLREISKSSDRATALTHQLLAFARKQIIEPRVLDLNQLILDMDKLLRRLIGENIELVTLPASDLGRVRADPGQIEQVVVNLAVNARDAMPNGGKLTIETRNVLLDHDYAHRHISVKPGHYILLAVSDTGTGMDDELQERIFEPFFTTKEPGRGTGLGLATCYGIIKQHGGNIWPYSEPGHGSAFKIYLPRIEAPVDNMPQTSDDNSLPRGGETVLLTEDEPSVRMLAARVLRDRGYTVLEATNGDDALHQARTWSQSPIDLLLTDVVMPQMSGKVLAERLKELYPSTKILFISGYTDNAIVHHGQLDAGIVFLQKPFSPAALARKVRDLLDSKDEQTLE